MVLVLQWTRPSQRPPSYGRRIAAMASAMRSPRQPLGRLPEPCMRREAPCVPEATFLVQECDVQECDPSRRSGHRRRWTRMVRDADRPSRVDLQRPQPASSVPGSTERGRHCSHALREGRQRFRRHPSSCRYFRMAGFVTDPNPLRARLAAVAGGRHLSAS